MWICGRGGRKCWIQPQSRKNSRVSRFRVSTTVYPTESDKSRNENSVVHSRLSRQYEVELMEPKNLMAKQQAEQQLKDRQIQLEH